MVTATRIAIIGPGKIARDAHRPALAAHPGFVLVASAGGPDGFDGLPHFADLPALLASGIGVDAVAICTPPGPRAAIAHAAWAAGLDVLLEKPPTASLAQAQSLRPPPGRVGMTAWHSRHGAAVAAAAAVLARRPPARFAITWVEDVERWHPGQHWIWAADGFGVLDPGINALSILTLIWPGPWTVTQSTPTIAAGAGAPERVEAGLACGPVAATVLFDWRSPSDRWDIVVELADGGQLALTAGGAQLVVDGVAQPVADHGEYDAVYAAFADCLAQRHSRIDVQPLELALAMLR